MRNSGLLAEKGPVLGLYGGRYLRHDGPEHVLAVAPTRSGKGVGLVVPTLLTWPGSAVIHDVKGEIWALTAGWRRSSPTACCSSPPTRARPASTRCSRCARALDEVRDVQNIADILVDPEGARERRDHWEKTAHALLSAPSCTCSTPKQEKTLARVASFLADPARSIRRTLWIMLTTNHIGTEDRAEVASRGGLDRPRAPEQVGQRALRRGVHRHELPALYRDPIIAATTARSDWRIADLMGAERPVSLYLVVPPSDISRTRPLVRLILNQIGRRLTETLEADAGPRRGASCC